MPPTFKPDIQRILLKKNIHKPLHKISTGLSPSTVLKFQINFNLKIKRLDNKSIHHISHNLQSGIQFVTNSFSLAVTNEIAYCFLFLHLLRCFNSVGSQSSRNDKIKCQEVPLGNLGFQRCMLLAQAYRSLPRPS